MRLCEAVRLCETVSWLWDKSCHQLQLDGDTQTGATTLNSVGNNACFANIVLNISRMAWQDKVAQRYSNASSDKDLEQGSASQLRWSGADVAMLIYLGNKTA